MTNAHKTEVYKLAELVECQGRLLYAVDINRWGISAPFSDPENSTIYRDTKYQLALDTFMSEERETDNTHYPNSPYGSIWDY